MSGRRSELLSKLLAVHYHAHQGSRQQYVEALKADEAVVQRVYDGMITTQVYASASGAAEQVRLIGQAVGAYVIEEVIGVGGFGSVCRGAHSQTKQVVAVKVPRAKHFGNTELLNKWGGRAARAMAVKHPGVVEIHEVAAHASFGIYIVMEFVEGPSLHEFIRKGFDPGLTVKQIVEFVKDLAEAAAALRAHGLLHLDIKPANVKVVREGDRLVPKLLDIDFSPHWQERRHRDEPLAGTLRYMAQEQRAVYEGGSHLGRLDIDEHTDGPVEDFRRRLEVGWRSSTHGIWINRYGYLSDAKLKVISEVCR